MEALLDDQRLSMARRAREDNLCDACLGRLFARVGQGTTNLHRGEVLREALGDERVDPDECFICDGLLNDLDNLAGRLNSVNALFDAYFHAVDDNDGIVNQHTECNDQCTK